MRKRCAMAVCAAAGFAGAAQAQEVFKITYSWFEVAANTTTPASGPLAGNSVVDPGEGARIFIHLNILKDGHNAVGMSTTGLQLSPPLPGTGIIAGLGAVIYRLDGGTPAIPAIGTITNRSFGSYFNDGAWRGVSVGTVIGSGAGIDNFGGAQYVAAGATANGTNPLKDFFRWTWTPAVYSNRTVPFRVGPPSIAAPWQQNSVLVKYGVAQPDPNDPSTWYDLYVEKFFGSDFGVVNVPIAPTPATGIVVFSAAMCFMRRTKRMGVAS